MSRHTREKRGYTYLTREHDDQEAEGKYLHPSFSEARQDADDFESLITNHDLRKRWLPVRIVHVVVTTTVDVQEAQP